MAGRPTGTWTPALAPPDRAAHFFRNQNEVNVTANKKEFNNNELPPTRRRSGASDRKRSEAIASVPPQLNRKLQSIGHIDKRTDNDENRENLASGGVGIAVKI